MQEVLAQEGGYSSSDPTLSNFSVSGLTCLEDASLNRTLIPGQSREELPCPKMGWPELFKEMQGIARSELRGWPRYRAGHVSLH
jgi:hypothetical protein